MIDTLNDIIEIIQANEDGRSELDAMGIVQAITEILERDDFLE